MGCGPCSRACFTVSMQTQNDALRGRGGMQQTEEQNSWWQTLNRCSLRSEEHCLDCMSGMCWNMVLPHHKCMALARVYEQLRAATTLLNVLSELCNCLRICRIAVQRASATPTGASRCGLVVAPGVHGGHKTSSRLQVPKCQ